MIKQSSILNIDCRLLNVECKRGRAVSRFLFYTLQLALLIFLTIGCYEPVEDCLDIRATNYAVDADNPCPDCCSYPEIIMNFSHRAIEPDTSFNLVLIDSVYEDGANNPFTIKEIQFFISNLRVIAESGVEVGVSDRVEISIPLPDGEVTLDSIEDNFALVDPSDFRASTIGTFASPGTYTAIRFTIGIEEPANQADPDALPEDHPLTTPDMHWSLDSGYVFNRIELFNDTTAADTIPFIIEIGGVGQTREVSLDFGQTFRLDNGFNLSLTLQIDYLSWFSTVNVKEDSAETMAAKIVEQVAESFSLIAVEPD